MDGGVWYQPPSLKTINSILLDRTRKDPSPNLQLYQSVQRVLDRLVDVVEDKILGFNVTGITKCGSCVYVIHCSDQVLEVTNLIKKLMI